MSFTSPEKEIIFLYIHDVITSPEKGKRSIIHYLHARESSYRYIGPN
jgi:hypothetical protein